MLHLPNETWEQEATSQAGGGISKKLLFFQDGRNISTPMQCLLFRRPDC